MAVWCNALGFIAPAGYGFFQIERRYQYHDSSKDSELN